MSDPIRGPGLLQYWSVRYFLIVSISVVIMSISVLSMLQITTLHNQKRSLEAMVRDVAAMAANNGGRLPDSPTLHITLEQMVSQHGLSSNPVVFILNDRGEVVQQHPPDPPDGVRQVDALRSKIIAGSAQVLEFSPSGSDVPYLVAVQPLFQPSEATEYVLYFEKKQNRLRELYVHSPRFTLLIFSLLIGWGVIYSMTRRLVKPIQEVAGAARQVAGGNYEVRLNKEYKETEIYELTHSFNEMVDRLACLEALRSQLLAGITKELKTPVDSVNRMVQAIKNGEVGGEEADDYLAASLKEIQRLQLKIEDLLEFNRFITGGVAVKRKRCDLESLIAGIVDRWTVARNESSVKVVKEKADERESWQVRTDPIRIEQILTHLLNNAEDAVSATGVVKVMLNRDAQEIRVLVQDSGRGISREEAENVFEPFYRGGDRKKRVRGLGIGLPFSRLIARSLGGDLVLSDGTPGNTTFTLTLPSEGPDQPVG